MIVLHHLNKSRSQRIIWLLEELGLPYEIKHYQRDKQTMLAPPELRAVHPLGKSPVITDGDITVAESGAIVEYLVDREGGRLRPAQGTPEFLRYRYWLHFAEGSAMPPLLMKLVFDKVASAPMPFFVKPVARGISAQVLKSFVMPNIERQLDFMEAELAQRLGQGGGGEQRAQHQGLVGAVRRGDRAAQRGRLADRRGEGGEGRGHLGVGHDAQHNRSDPAMLPNSRGLKPMFDRLLPLISP